MKERPILFSAPMVQGVLCGVKEQTRRKLSIQPKRSIPGAHFVECGGLWHYPNICPHIHIRCPYGMPGDRLWVRETWAYSSGKLVASNSVVQYKADGEKLTYDTRWHPSIHMFRWMSRITLEIKNIRVERLQDITDADAIKEGIERVGGPASCSPWKNYMKGKPGEMILECSAPARSFMTLWESINGKTSWESNPWVWVVEFERVKP